MFSHKPWNSREATDRRQSRRLKQAVSVNTCETIISPQLLGICCLGLYSFLITLLPSVKAWGVKKWGRGGSDLGYLGPDKTQHHYSTSLVMSLPARSLISVCTFTHASMWNRSCCDSSALYLLPPPAKDHTQMFESWMQSLFCLLKKQSWRSQTGLCSNWSR